MRGEGRSVGGKRGRCRGGKRRSVGWEKGRCDEGEKKVDLRDGADLIL